MRATPKKLVAVLATAGLLTLTAACGGDSGSGGGGGDSSDVEVFTWWAEGSEKEGLDALVTPRRIAGDDDIAPSRQRASDRVESLAAHDDGLAEGHALEVGQVFRQVPGELVVYPDAAPGVDGHDQGQAGHRMPPKGKGKGERLGIWVLVCVVHESRQMVSPPFVPVKPAPAPGIVVR